MSVIVSSFVLVVLSVQDHDGTEVTLSNAGSALIRSHSLFQPFVGKVSYVDMIANASSMPLELVSFFVVVGTLAVTFYEVLKPAFRMSAVDQASANPSNADLIQSPSATGRNSPLRRRKA